MTAIHLKGSASRNLFAAILVANEGPDGARAKTSGPMREAVEAAIAEREQQQAETAGEATHGARSQ